MQSTLLSPQSTKRKNFPNYGIVVYDDNVHSLKYFIEVILEVFKYSEEKTKELVFVIKKKGKDIVWTGNKEVAEFMEEKILNFGPDKYSNITEPLKVSIVEI